MFIDERFFGITAAEVDSFCPLILPLLQEFEQTTAVVTAEEIIDQAKRKACQLWGYHDGDDMRCVVATTVNEGIGRKGCLVWVCVGHDFMELAHGVITHLEEWARSIGCTHMEIVGRAGWAKVIPDYARRAVVFEKAFTEKAH